jgi:RHS repeat-associated protein
MYEDGFRLDRLLLITDTTYLPTGAGPAETARQTETSPPPTTTVNRTIAYTYDDLYRLTNADYSTGEFFDYTYDASSNRRTQTTLAGTTVYTYDQANRLTEVDGQTYTWDDNGRLLDDGARTFTYNTANQLTGVTTGAATTQFEYNGDGDRVAQVVDGVRTDYALDPLGLTQVLVTSSGGQSTHFLPGLAQYGSSGWQYFAGDRLGSVRQVIDPAGALNLAQGFDPFGNLFEQTGAGQSIFGYAGEQMDPTGLVFLRARHYDPVVGRFFTPDPFPGLPTLPGTLHPYNYGLNNPILYTDPSGEIVPVIIAGAAIGAAFGGIGYVVTHPGEDYFHSRGFWTSVGIGALSGAVGGGVGGWVAGAGILGGGFWAAVAGGAAGGAAAGAVGQTAANLLDPCADWHEGVAEAAVQGAVIGGITGGVGYGIGRGVAAIRAGRASSAANPSGPRRIYSARELVRRSQDPGPYHNFPGSFDDVIFRGNRTVVSDDYILYTQRGSVNGRPGTFEIGVRPSPSERTEVITHRFFRPD